MARQALVGDFETGSFCDLKEAGAWRYAEDPTTEIFCFCWGMLGDDAEHEWRPGMDTTELRRLAEDPNVIFLAHNAGFEKSIWRKIMMVDFGMPDIPNDRWHDIMAVAAMKAVPMKLEKAVQVLGLPAEKDMAGSRFTIALSKPNKKGALDRSPASLQRATTYCHQDVRSEKGLHRRVGWLTPEERKVWLLDQAINERGVRLDRDYIRQCQKIVRDVTSPMLARFSALTGYAPTQVAKVLAWMKTRGVEMPNLQKETIIDFLGKDIDGGEIDWENYSPRDLPEDVREALTIRQVTGSASVKKLFAMLACVCADGRARGALAYHGAGPGRWAGRLFQPQNFPRPEWEDHTITPSMVVDAIMTGDAEYVRAVLGEPVEAVIFGLRHAIIANKGHALIAGDFAGIEARVVLALAGQTDKLALMAAGEDPYCVFGGMMLGYPINKKDHAFERQKYGKPGVLGGGFGQGPAGFVKKYGVPMEMAERIVATYREDWAPKVPPMWYRLKDAVRDTVHTGAAHETDGVRFAMEDGWMTARLPSGRKLWYWKPGWVSRPDRTLTKDEFRKYAAGFNVALTTKDIENEIALKRDWGYMASKQGRTSFLALWYGLITENLVQALARDLLVYSMFLLEDNGYPIILTVHDEIVSEVPEALVNEKEFRQIMEVRPPWAIDMQLPVSAEPWSGYCYRKA